MFTSWELFKSLQIATCAACFKLLWEFGTSYAEFAWRQRGLQFVGQRSQRFCSQSQWWVVLWKWFLAFEQWTLIRALMPNLKNTNYKWKFFKTCYGSLDASFNKISFDTKHFNSTYHLTKISNFWDFKTHVLLSLWRATVSQRFVKKYARQ